MSLLIIVGCIWGICKAISAASARAKEKARQAEIERVRRAQEHQRAEQARMREEWKAAQAAERERVRQMVELEKEQARQAKEQERIAKEQEKQAAQLAKHEERLMKLEQRMALAEREINHYKPLLDDLKKKEEELSNKAWYYDSIGLPCSGVKKELEKVSEKVYRMETKVIKAEQDKAFCEKQMSA